LRFAAKNLDCLALAAARKRQSKYRSAAEIGGIVRKVTAVLRPIGQYQRCVALIKKFLGPFAV
jgi:hypothetical protein